MFQHNQSSSQMKANKTRGPDNDKIEAMEPTSHEGHLRPFGSSGRRKSFVGTFPSPLEASYGIRRLARRDGRRRRPQHGRLRRRCTRVHHRESTSGWLVGPHRCRDRTHDRTVDRNRFNTRIIWVLGDRRPIRETFRSDLKLWGGQKSNFSKCCQRLSTSISPNFGKLCRESELTFHPQILQMIKNRFSSWFMK